MKTVDEIVGSRLRVFSCTLSTLMVGTERQDLDEVQMNESKICLISLTCVFRFNFSSCVDFYVSTSTFQAIGMKQLEKKPMRCE